MATKPAVITEDQPLPPDYWAVICSIGQEPKYQFVGSEGRLAERMTEQGLLERQEKKRYTITPYGQECYTANLLLAVKP